MFQILQLDFLFLPLLVLFGPSLHLATDRLLHAPSGHIHGWHTLYMASANFYMPGANFYMASLHIDKKRAEVKSEKWILL